MKYRTQEAINKGFEEIQKKGSKVITEGYHMLPNASLMIASGVIKNLSDRKKPFVTVVNSHSTHIPGHIHLDVLGKIITERLKRKGFTVDKINHILEIYRYIYTKGMNTTQAVHYIEEEFPATDERDEITTFIRESGRGIIKRHTKNNLDEDLAD